MVARASAAYSFSVHPVSYGAAVLRVVPANGKGTTRFARIEEKSIKLLPELSSGAPSANGSSPVLMASGDTYWMAVNRSTAKSETCEVFQFQAGTWASVGKTNDDQGACEQLAAWTPGAAIVALRGQKGASLMAFGGKATAPALVQSPKGKCQITPMALGGWSSGEVMVFGVDCNASTHVLAYPANAKKPIVWESPIDGNSPYEAYFLSKESLVVYGGGVLPADPNTEVPVRVDVSFDGKKLTQTAMVERASPKEVFFIPKGIEQMVTTDGGFTLASGDVIQGGQVMLMAGTLTSSPSETVLLSNQSVSEPLSLRE